MAEEQSSVSTSPELAANVKLSIKENACYGFGCTAMMFPFSLVLLYLNFFWTDVVKIPALIVGTFMMVNKLWDAINDPIVGAIADRSQFKGGRYRPWLIPSGLSVTVLGILLFTTIPGVSPNFQYVFSFVAYFLYVLGFTALEIPHVSMMSTITTSYEARGVMTAWRQTNAGVTITIISAAFLPLVAFFGKGNDGTGYFWAVVVLQLCSIPFYYICSKGVRERVVPPAETNKVPFRESYKCLKGNMPALMLMLAHLTWGASAGFGTTGNIYFWTYIAGDTNLFTLNNTIKSGAGIFAGILMGFLVKTIGNKRNIAAVCWSLAALCYFALYFVPVTTPGGINLFNIISVGQSLTGGVGFICLFSLVPDVTEYTVVKYKLKASGFLFAVINFCYKFGMSITAGLFSWLLGAMQYQPGVAQPQNILTLIRLSVSVIPGVSTVIGVIAYCFYKLNKETHEEALRLIAKEG